MAKKHWFLVSYTAHNPFTSDTVNAVLELPWPTLWQPGDIKHVTAYLNAEMVATGYEGYTRPIITSVHYMGLYDE